MCNFLLTSLVNHGIYQQYSSSIFNKYYSNYTSTTCVHFVPAKYVLEQHNSCDMHKVSYPQKPSCNYFLVYMYNKTVRDTCIQNDTDKTKYVHRHLLAVSDVTRRALCYPLTEASITFHPLSCFSGTSLGAHWSSSLPEPW